jgi:hypothetical protein
MDNAIVPLVAAHPDWAPRILRGALWRSTVNAAFFTALWRDLSGAGSAAA